MAQPFVIYILMRLAEFLAQAIEVQAAALGQGYCAGNECSGSLLAC